MSSRSEILSSLPFKLPFDLLEPTSTGKPTSQLLQDLHSAAETKVKFGSARKKDYPLWTDSSKKITGWSFREWDYGKPNITLASNARGLFTIEEPSNDGYHERIVVRGYDKFFNLNELPNLNWNWITKNSKGPYEVTSKENGCIIFISGLSDGTLIVTSKHSTGSQEGKPDEEVHSFVGQSWIRRHLESKGIKETDFAKLLYAMNVTAVGELCDDSFEEHVLAYPPDQSGIYLHGLNLNVSKFTTYPFPDVEAFAKMFGFLPTEYLTIETVAELRTFLETCAETGSWNDREVEGFVIRTKTQQDPTNPESYSDYFFKYKFEEPYLMYRQWREVTRAYLAGKSRNEIAIKKNKVYTNKYLDFAIPLLSQNEELRESYNRNHGIIEVRQRFLAAEGISGAQMVELELQHAEEHKEPQENKYVLVPVATIGCGKTTVAVALTHLFPKWAHIQNDEIVKSPKPINFAKTCVGSVRYANNVVIADRNNHQKRERQQILADIEKLKAHDGIKNVFICLDFWAGASNKNDDEKLWDVTTKRVLERGDNHQTIAADSIERGKLIAIMKGFVNRFEPVDTNNEPDSLFDDVIKLESVGTDSSRKNLEVIINHLHEKYPEIVPTLPTKEEMDAAFEKALKYKPAVKSKGTQQYSQTQKKEKKKKARYFAIKVEAPESVDSISASLEKVSISANTSGSENKERPEFANLIEKLFQANPSADTSMWKKLQEKDRVQSEFHVTLAHRSQHGPNSSDQTAKAIFEGYQREFAKQEVENSKKQQQQQKQTTTASSTLATKDSNSDSGKLSSEKVDKDGFQLVQSKNRAKDNLPGFGSTPVELELYADIVLKNLCWDGKIMAVEVQVQEVASAENSQNSQNGVADASGNKVVVACCNKAPHITIGTINSSVAAVQAGQVLEKNEEDLVKLAWNIEPRVLKSQPVAAYF